MKINTINQILILMFLIALLIAGCGGGGGSSEVSENVTENKIPIPDTVRKKFELDAYYQQWVDARGLPVVSRENVNPYALEEAAWLIQQVFGHRPDVLQAMAEKKVRFAVIPYNKRKTEIPEYSEFYPGFLHDFVYIRGATASQIHNIQTMSSGEENLLNYPGDPHWKESMLIGFLSASILRLELLPEIDNRLTKAFEKAREKWNGTTASVAKTWYWAEGTQSWFDANRENDSRHNHVNTRTELKAFDPDLATLLTEVFGDTEWRYTPAVMRTDMLHLRGFDPQDSPTFEWPSEFSACYQINPELKRCGEWVNLNQDDPNKLSSLTSENKVDTKIYFINASSADIFIYWKHYDGNVVAIPDNNGDLLKVPQSDYRRLNTKDSHVFLIRNQDGEDLAVFQAQEKTGLAVYRESN